jgi:hypothetical protein
MKKMILIVAMFAGAFMQQTFAQNSATQTLQIVITDYLNLKNALTKDNADTAKAASNSLSADLKKMPMEKLTPDQHKIWMKYNEGLSNGSTLIGSTTDISKQRDQLKNLSSNFYKMLKEMKINTTELYYQYCPMADAYWISEKSTIVNPYFGKKMLSCGSTKETLKENK